jgi:hypothetical protein
VQGYGFAGLVQCRARAVLRQGLGRARAGLEQREGKGWSSSDVVQGMAGVGQVGSRAGVGKGWNRAGLGQGWSRAVLGQERAGRGGAILRQT